MSKWVVDVIRKREDHVKVEVEAADEEAACEEAEKLVVAKAEQGEELAWEEEDVSYDFGETEDRRGGTEDEA